MKKTKINKEFLILKEIEYFQGMLIETSNRLDELYTKYEHLENAHLKEPLLFNIIKESITGALIMHTENLQEFEYRISILHFFILHSILIPNEQTHSIEEIKIADYLIKKCKVRIKSLDEVLIKLP